ncbi:EAL domain-containing protein [Pseudomonas stutzeri]|uniref:putative bifunctional diguanylate cyclase/phosphodiesterase n=1 Tax=Stutzerimonas TaxID=2901164 RepID=UPI000F7AF971|nr:MULTISPECIES: EAL domain-containing protein [Stutzerimonas]MCF0014555.1 EAL domain-containing protein [Stutzerimonas stutzeri]MCF0018377.1 EAL domain-containing protein [Stutzerimonas stutzeri]MDH0442525.1 EAL domain-containing protein [Stutzerimonas stutzeri]MDH1586431.1 EAL domain-containing protein [Stutzerimonas stutzeri]MDL2172655.1 EAL domain-containing protein [Stutzerimonas sp. FeSN7]
MKIHTDAASRLATEVVTQLPVPSRLGMLRFERLNESSWTLLFLDPACERSIGVCAADLCSLVDSPYASLMEPSARHQLHEDIQQQLAERGHYSVSYRLHGPEGVLEITELGEAFQQYGRELLRGYLMSGGQPESEQDLRVQNARLRAALQQHEQAQDEHIEHMLRSRTQQNLIVRLARHRYGSTNPQQEAAQLITQAACEVYELGRATIWHLNGTRLEPVACYRLDGDHYETPPALELAPYPRYLQALQSGRAIDAQDVGQDHRTCELDECVYRPQAIRSILDASIRVGGEVIGVLSLQHSGKPRAWHADEIAFAGELADQYAQVLANQQRLSATHMLGLFQRAVEQSASAFILVDRDGRVEYVNPAFTAISQFSESEVRGQRLADLKALENLGELLFDTSSVLAHSNSWQGEFRSRRKNLEPYWGQLSISKVFNDDGMLTHYIGIYEDITRSKLAHQHIERLAYTDNLTNLGNRPFFIRSIEERFAAGAEPRLCLLLVDIDNFKRINDSLGHQTGDKLLTSLARRLRNGLSQQSVLARFASNEFALLFDDKGLEEGIRLADQVLRILDKPLFVDKQLISVSGSLGLACSPQHGRDPETLMKHAGQALHKAKANGKNQVQIFTEALHAEANYKLFVENNLRRALLQNELEVFYQPKLCLHTGRLQGLEALLRWNHPEKGMIRPDQFISVAEETGLIIPIGKWVVREACRMGVTLSELGLGKPQIAINLSPKQFSDPDLLSSIAAILLEEKLPAGQLELELTESLLLDATEETRQQLIGLKALGLTLAMDDFGTGYSSLSYLKKFPIDVIKIDRSFIKDIPDNQDDVEITSAVIAMARKLHLKVVAEGIETPEQLKFLRRHRCDIGQGYLFDKPIPGTGLTDALRRYPHWC